MTTKKDFASFAEVIAKMPDLGLREALYATLGNKLAAHNPKFNWDKWRQACDVTPSIVLPMFKMGIPIKSEPPKPKPMSDVKLGTIIEGDASKDAIHVCLAPCVAAHYLCPGDHVGILEDGKAGGSPNPVGIVDPFLKEGVQEGQKFWVCIYPGTIKGLRHEWEHPAFKVEPKLPEPEPEEDDDWCGTTGCS